MVQAKRAIEEAPLLSRGAFKPGANDPVGTISASSGFLGKWHSPEERIQESDGE
jgi:hypothetical protein